MPDTTQKFREEMLKLGVISFHDQDTLYDIAKKCARTTGIPMGGAGAVMGAGAGAVTVPVVGAVPGYVAGFLAGMFTGTVMCTVANSTLKDELKKLLRY